MVGRIVLKRVIKQTAGWAAVLTAPFTRRPVAPRVCILAYHRITDVDFTDPHLDNWNVTPKTFERQIAGLADFAEFVPLLDLPRRLAHASASTKPLVCLTFDDGYANFCTQALPILKGYGAPATVFVVTSFVGSKEPMTFDRWGRKNVGRAPVGAWRPLDWAQLETCLKSELISVGSHSHRHLDGHGCSEGQLIEEAERSRAILGSRLGEDQTRAYAYPYGSTRLGEVSPEYVSAVRAAGYQLAVSTDLGLACSASDPYLLPRVEAHTLDSPAVLRAKVFGALAPYYLTDRLRTAKRGV